jgi:ADP-ribose pyrophosphatase YjhB (NUDIX family)
MALAGSEDNVSCCSAMLRWLLRIWIQLPAPLRYLYLRLRYGRYGVGMAALIHDDRGRIMVVRRTYSRDEPWALPGGWLEGGDEALERGLERELFEETGLRVRVGGIKAFDRHGFAVVLLLEAELLDPTSSFRASAEVSEVAWVEPTAVGRLNPLNARLLRQAQLL